MKWYFLLRMVAMPLTLLDAMWGDLLGHCEWLEPFDTILRLFAERRKRWGFNWWGHSVCDMRIVPLAGNWEAQVVNDWGDSWSDSGEGVLSPEAAKLHKIKPLGVEFPTDDLKKVFGLD